MLKPPLDSFFTLAKRKLDLSKTRKRIGSKGGKTERIPVTTEQVKAADTMRGQSIEADAEREKTTRSEGRIPLFQKSKGYKYC